MIAIAETKTEEKTEPPVSLEDIIVERALKALAVRKPKPYPVTPSVVDKRVNAYLSERARTAAPSKKYAPKQEEVYELVA